MSRGVKLSISTRHSVFVLSTTLGPFFPVGPSNFHETPSICSLGSVSVYYVAVRTIVLSVLLRPTQSESDEPSDLRGSLSPTTRHRCTMS